MRSAPDGSCATRCHVVPPCFHGDPPSLEEVHPDVCGFRPGSQVPDPRAGPAPRPNRRRLGTDTGPNHVGGCGVSPGVELAASVANRARAARSPEAARTAALPISAFCPVFSGAFTVRFVTFSPSSGGHCSSPTRRSCAVFSRELGWMARRGDPRGPSNAHVRVHVGGALVPRSAKWGRLVRRFWPVFGTLEYAAGTMDAGWPPNAGEQEPVGPNLATGKCSEGPPLG